MHPAEDFIVYPFGHGNDWHWEILGPRTDSAFKPITGCCDTEAKSKKTCPGFASRDEAVKNGMKKKEAILLLVAKASATTV